MHAIDRFLDFFETHKIPIVGTVLVHFLIIALFSLFGLSKSAETTTSVIKMDFSEPKVVPTEKEIKEQAKQEVTRDLANATNKAKNLSSTSKLPADYNKINEKSVNNQQRSSVEEEINERLKNLEQEVIAEQRASGYGYTAEEAEALINSKKQQELEQVVEKEAQSEGAVSGPTNISYRLANRYDTYIYVPVYLCEEGGEVTVNIVVDRSGKVAGAKVDQESSKTSSSCLLNAALKAAKAARFNASSSAEKLQNGSMTFRFLGN